MLIDSYGRRLDYLRLSVTDLCNLRCIYCMPETGVCKIPHDDILSYEELLQVAQVAVSLGVKKIRLTGGEPLVRKDIIDFTRKLAALDGLEILTLTTNGIRLPALASDLRRAGVQRVNISLDSLDRENFRRLAGRDLLDHVWQGIETALTAGFTKVKINTVVIRGMNDHELLDLARLSLDLPLEVRFIEFMPMGQIHLWSADRLIPSREIMDRLGQLGELIPVEREQDQGPARIYRFPGAKGAVGFISPVTQHFCKTCNRLRLTADGKLRLCLLSDDEFDLKSALRRDASTEELRALILEAVKNKPASHLLAEENSHTPFKSMRQIGG